MGAFDHLNGPLCRAFERHFGPGRGGFEQYFSKKSNSRGVSPGGGGMLKLRFDRYITNGYLQKACMRCKRFSVKERKNDMFLIDLPYCLIVFFVVCPRLTPLPGPFTRRRKPAASLPKANAQSASVYFRNTIPLQFCRI